MTPKQFKEALETLGLTQVEFARLMEVTPRHVNRWGQGDVAVPRAEGILLRLLVAKKIKLKDLG